VENTGVAPPSPPAILTPAIRRTALAAVLGLAACLRFAALDRQGLLFFDEGHLIMEARTCERLWILSARTLLPGTVTARMEARRAIGGEIRESRITFGKPAHNQALAVILSLCRRADRATFILSASAGVATVWIVYLLGASAYGPAAGLAGAFILTLSPYHLLYSREGLSDSLTVFCWTACLAAWLRTGTLSAVISGILGGLCIATNYRDLILPLLVLAVSRKQALRFAFWLAAFGLTLAAFEVPYRIWLAAAGPDVRFPQGTYLRQLGDLLSYHGAQGFGFSGFGAFAHHLSRWEGAVSLIFLIGVLPFQLARWKGPDRGINLGLIIPWLLFSAYWDNAPRFFTPLLPLIALAKGRWLLIGAALLTRPPAGGGASPLRGLPPLVAKAAVGLIAAAILVLPLVPALRLVPRPTPYLKAVEFLLQSGSPKHVSTSMRIGRAYLGDDKCLASPVSPSEIPGLRRQGVRYAVVDMQAMFGGFERSAERYATSVRLAACCPTIREYPYGGTALSQFILEQDLGFPEALRILAYLEPLHPRLKVVDMSGCRLPCIPRSRIPVF